MRLHICGVKQSGHLTRHLIINYLAFRNKDISGSDRHTIQILCITHLICLSNLGFWKVNKPIIIDWSKSSAFFVDKRLLYLFSRYQGELLKAGQSLTFLNLSVPRKVFDSKLEKSLGQFICRCLMLITYFGKRKRQAGIR